MIQLYDVLVNTPVSVVAKASSTTAPTDILLLAGGAPSASPVTFTSLNANLATYSFTPTTTGTYTLYADTNIVAVVEVVSKQVKSFLQNIEDECLGSWTWDKTLGQLTLFRSDGTTLATYTMTDTLTDSSRERLT